MLADKLRMASGGQLLVDVGSFQQPAAGTQVVTGVGFKPKAIIFFTSGGRTGGGSWDSAIYQCVGFTAGPASSYAVAGFSDDALATSNSSRRMEAKAITIVRASETVSQYADLVSFDNDGFTLEWVRPSGVGGIDYMFLALGGDIQAEVLNWQCKGATGSHSVSTGTFQPDLVFHTGYMSPTGLPTSSTGMVAALGVMNAAGEQWGLAVSAQDAVSPSNTTRYQRTDSCFLGMDSAGTERQRAAFTSMDAGGFTVNFAVSSGTDQMASLCIKGVKSKLGSFTKTTAAAPALQSITAPGFPPAVWLTLSDQRTAQTTPQATAALGIGATDGTNQRTVAQMDRDGQNPTQADSIFSNTQSLIIPGTGPTLENAATIALTATGADYTWDPNTVDAWEILYAALAAK